MSTAPNRVGDAPYGFVLAAKSLTRVELMSRYQRSGNTIDRWCEEKGVQPRPFRVSGAHLMSTPPVRLHLDQSRAGRAADFLRKYGPVSRCDATGAPLEDGFFWRRGSFVLTDEDIIARATRLGWEAPR